MKMSKRIAKKFLTAYTDDALKKASLIAGLKLYGVGGGQDGISDDETTKQAIKRWGIDLSQYPSHGGLSWRYPEKITHLKLSEYIKNYGDTDPENFLCTPGDEGGGYIFKPESSEGIDTGSDSDRFLTDKELRSSDGKLYMADTMNVEILVIEFDLDTKKEAIKFVQNLKK